MNKHGKTTRKNAKIKRAKEGPDKKLKAFLAKHIQNVRKRRGFTARKAAEDMGMKRTTLTQMENGNNHFNAVVLYKLASVLKCDIKELFPSVPESISLTDADAAEVAQEDAHAAELLKSAFLKK